jgi:hypothetical protein
MDQRSMAVGAGLFGQAQADPCPTGAVWNFNNFTFIIKVLRNKHH